jgi:hypothetical protein
MGLNGNNGWTSDDAELTGGTQLEHHLPHNEGGVYEAGTSNMLSCRGVPLGAKLGNEHVRFICNRGVLEVVQGGRARSGGAIVGPGRPIV